MTLHLLYKANKNTELTEVMLEKWKMRDYQNRLQFNYTLLQNVKQHNMRANSVWRYYVLYSLYRQITLKASNSEETFNKLEHVTRAFLLRYAMNIT